MKYVSVCSGMEAASVAWHELGWTPVAFAEIEPFPSAILKHRFPNTPNYGDLTKYKEWPIEPGTVDLVVGGTPCQAFSVAGLRKGLTDPRGNLALTFLGLVQHLRPRWVLWENVPGVLSSGKPAGSDFACFLAGLGELGYGWAYRVCDAQFYGVPQRRRRVFLVASSTGDWRVAAETLSLAEGMRGYLEASDAKRKGTARRAKGGSGADGLEGTIGTLCADSHPGAYSGQDAYTGRLIPQAFGGNNTSGSIQVATALTAHGGPHGRQDFASETFIAQPFTASSFAQYQEGVGTLRANGGDLGGGSETLAVQPIPIHDQATRFAGKRGDKQDGKGNGLGVGKPGDPCPTLTRGDHHAVAIPYRKAKRAQSDKDDETWVEADQSNTLNNFDLGDTRTTHAVVEPIPLDMRNAGRDPEKKDEMNRQGLGVGNPGDPSHTITSAFVHGVAHEQKLYENHPNDSRVTGPLEVAPTVVSRFGTGGGNIPFVHPAENVVSPTVTTCKGSRGGCSSEAIDEITAIHQAQGVDLYNQTLTGDVHVPLRTAGGHGAPAAITPIGDKSSDAVSFDTYNQSLSDTSQAIRSAASDVDHVGAVFQPSMAVRRLSVRECERLQGFPDDWSLIPWKGKPLSECPDGPRYKACGNSMAVPVMRHLGKAIDAMDKKLKGNS